MSENNENMKVRPDVLNYDDIRRLVPKLDGHEKFVNWLLHFLSVDKVNRVHSNCCDTPGPEFTRRLLFDEFKMTLRVDNSEILDHLPEGAFITVSNHPFGALDGIALIYLIGSRRPEFKVLVNMILNQISAMRPNFIAVDPLASNDPSKRAVSVNGIRQALRQLHDGNPVGFFPAGAMSKTTLRHGLQDREWQKSVLQIIHRAKVPVIPVFFHGGNSWWCDFLGHVCWPARSLRLPAEVFRKNGKEMHVSIGNPISVEEQALHNSTPEELGKFLREKTYELSKLK
ncbi:MAG: lysophospholipid acyltransferase family protein [Muribaculaceae bacterium]|nr:lysophospholipid acyltransferase family protein [Muribaculaceae bacterium]